MFRKHKLLLPIALVLICCSIASADNNRLTKGRVIGDFWVLSKKYDFSKHTLLCEDEFGVVVTSHVLATIPIYTVRFHTPALSILDFKWVMPNSGIVDHVDESIVSAEVVLTLDGKQVAQSIVTATTGPTGDTEPFYDIANFHDFRLGGTLYKVKAGWHTLKIQAAVLDDNDPNDDDVDVYDVSAPDGGLYLPQCGSIPIRIPTDDQTDPELNTATPITFPVGYLDLRGVVAEVKKVYSNYSNSDSDSYSNSNYRNSDSDSNYRNSDSDSNYRNSDSDSYSDSYSDSDSDSSYDD